MSLRAQLSTTPGSARITFISGLFLTVLVSLLTEFHSQQQRFTNEVESTAHFIETKVDSFEVALESFANFLAVSPGMSDAEIRGYTQGVRKIFPELYMFEVATRVEQSERPAFEEMMRWKGYSDFRIHGFDYAESRQVTELDDQPFYYVIRFIDPEFPGASAVLGLDLIHTSDALVETLMAALKAPRPIASKPFSLLEGGKGYVIYRPAVPNGKTGHALPAEETEFAMLAVRGNDLLPQWIKDDNDFRVTLSYVTQTAEDISESLIEADTNATGRGLYRFSKAVQIHNQSQPFRLTVEKVICFSCINWLSLLSYLLIGFSVSLYISMKICRADQKKRMEQNERNRLYLQANFDALTGLPNTNLLMDRAEQAVLRAERTQGTVAICYMDINKFKEVNDNLGHDAGDELLIQIANRLKEKLRTEDTIARIHGDEFVILLPQVNGPFALREVQDKVLAVFDKPFLIFGKELKMTTSTGTASYPDDGHSLEELLSKSDKRMYMHKEKVSRISEPA